MNAKCLEVWKNYRMDLMPQWTRELFAELAGEIQRLEMQQSAADNNHAQYTNG